MRLTPDLSKISSCIAQYCHIRVRRSAIAAMTTEADCNGYTEQTIESLTSVICAYCLNLHIALTAAT